MHGFQMVRSSWDFGFGGFEKLLVSLVDQFGNFAADQVAGLSEHLYPVVTVLLDGG